MRTVQAIKMAIKIHDLLSLLMVNSQALPQAFSAVRRASMPRLCCKGGPCSRCRKVRRGHGALTDSIAQRTILSTGVTLWERLIPRQAPLDELGTSGTLSSAEGHASALGSCGSGFQPRWSGIRQGGLSPNGFGTSRQSRHAAAWSRQHAGPACGETGGEGGKTRKDKDRQNCLHFSPFRL